MQGYASWPIQSTRPPQAGQRARVRVERDAERVGLTLLAPCDVFLKAGRGLAFFLNLVVPLHPPRLAVPERVIVGGGPLLHIAFETADDVG